MLCFSSNIFAKLQQYGVWRNISSGRGAKQPSFIKLYSLPCSALLCVYHLLCWLLCRQLIVLLYIRRLPRIANPHVANCSCSQVSIIIEHVVGEEAFLFFILVLLECQSWSASGEAFTEIKDLHGEQKPRKRSSRLCRQASDARVQHPSPIPSQHTPT